MDLRFCCLTGASALGLIVASFITCPTTWADESLAQTIDRIIDQRIAGQQPEGKPAQHCSDAEFVRRTTLDLIGRIPTAAEARAFVADSDPSKRSKWIESLMASPEHPAHLANVFHTMLMERQGEHPLWKAWLLESFTANKPWDQMVVEMLTPHAADGPQRGAGFFVTKRLEHEGQNPIDRPGLTRDVGRLLLGVDLECAQCHDHPVVESYKQVDYQGLFVFFSNATMRPGPTSALVDETPLKAKVAFQSVFDKQPMEVGPRLPFAVEQDFPKFEPGQEFETPPDRQKNLPGVLKFSPLKTLANSLPKADTPGFSRNIANRMWQRWMGRGLIAPLDWLHDKNPPSHPELLDALAQHLVANKYDLRSLLKAIVTSETYARSSTSPEIAATNETAYQVALERGLSPEQMGVSLFTATGPWPDTGLRDELTTKAVKSLGPPAKTAEDDFAPSVKGALFVSHDATLFKLLQPQPGNLVERMSKSESSETAIEEAFWSVLSRPPKDEEKAASLELIANRPLVEAAPELVWALLASNEFRLNH